MRIVNKSVPLIAHKITGNETEACHLTQENPKGYPGGRGEELSPGANISSRREAFLRVRLIPAAGDLKSTAFAADLPSLHNPHLDMLPNGYTHA